MADTLYHVGDAVIVRDRLDLESDQRFNHGDNNSLYTSTCLFVPDGMMMEVCGRSFMVVKIADDSDGETRYMLSGTRWLFDDDLLIPAQAETDEWDDTNSEIGVLL